MRFNRHGWRATAVLLASLATLACSDDDPTDSPGGLAVSVEPAELAMVPPNTGTVTVTVGRFGTVVYPISLSISGMPAGVSATIVPSQLTTETETNATVNVTVGNTAPLGGYVITVTATAPNTDPVSASFHLTLVVPVAPRH